MEQSTTNNTKLRDVYTRLGPRNTVVQDTLTLLHGRNIKASRSAVYNTIDGRSHRRDITEAFLEAAEAELTRRKQVAKRARQLATNA